MYTADAAGAYGVCVGGLTGSFTVEGSEQPPEGFPWMYVVIGVVIVAAAVYYLYSKQKKE